MHRKTTLIAALVVTVTVQIADDSKIHSEAEEGEDSAVTACSNSSNIILLVVVDSGVITPRSVETLVKTNHSSPEEDSVAAAVMDDNIHAILWTRILK